MTTHPAGPHSVADILTQMIRQRIRVADDAWAEETDETTWRAEDCSDDCRRERWVIIAIGQLAPREPNGGRPGPLVVAAAEGIEMRIQLPYVVGQDQLLTIVGALVDFGVIGGSE